MTRAVPGRIGWARWRATREEGARHDERSRREGGSRHMESVRHKTSVSQWRVIVTLAPLCWAVCAGVFAQGQPAPSSSNAVVQQPRSFGYVLGDIVTQRVQLALSGQSFEPAALPTPAPAGLWLERRSVRLEPGAQGTRWLVLDYQVMNAPQALTVISLPALSLAGKNGGPALTVPEWPFTIAPLTPQKTLARAGLTELQADRSAALIRMARLERAVVAGIVALLASLAAWAAWWSWRNWRAASSQPFAVAWREMRNAQDTEPRAWHALHRAFDRTAGRATHAESLPALFERAPHLQPLRPRIERFFEQSRAWFFGGQEPLQPVSVRALCAELRRLEKRHET